MTESTATSPEVAERIAQVEDLPDDLRAEIVARREAGTTLAELKANFPQVAPDVIRDVLPPANARERKARAKKDVEKNAQTGQPDSSTPKAPTTATGPATPAETAPRYVADEDVVRELAAGITSARVAGFSRASLAELLGMTGRNAIWRTEVAGKVQADEVDPIRKLLARIKSGELKPPERRAAGAGGSKPPREKRDVLKAKLDAVTQWFHLYEDELEPESRDALAAIVGAPKSEEDEEEKE